MWWDLFTGLFDLMTSPRIVVPFFISVGCFWAAARLHKKLKREEREEWERECRVRFENEQLRSRLSGGGGKATDA